jgi:hypothetical protein
MATKNLSGADWYNKNQSKYPNSSSINDLSSNFKDAVTKFIKALEDAGATVKPVSTLRDPTRAFLMHWSWTLAKGKVKAAKVPSRSGLDIEWDHGDEKESQSAAKEMVDKFDMKDDAALNSNHLTGDAIDMTISWSGTLKIKNANGEDVEITSSPRTGENKELQAVGETYGVVSHKKSTDENHWSVNGH